MIIKPHPKLETHRLEVRKNIRAQENKIINYLINSIDQNSNWQKNTFTLSKKIIQELKNNKESSIFDKMLAEYSLSNDEGIALMCLSEAYLRTPDTTTIDALIEDKILGKKWVDHKGNAESLLVNASTWSLILLGRFLDDDEKPSIWNSLHNLTQKMSLPLIRTTILQIMKILGSNFILGRTINEAISQGEHFKKIGYNFSFDMLGEAAITKLDAENYLKAYSNAIDEIAKDANSTLVHDNNGISIKLSALHPRYEELKFDRVLDELTPKVLLLCKKAAKVNIPLNIDAEENARLDISLDVIDRVVRSENLKDWQGFGIVVQSYHRAASFVIDWFYELAKTYNRKFAIRLVKGAYWDSEIKLAQITGDHDYPVFTRKSNTDLSFLACANKLKSMSNRIYSQFATHNAQSSAAIIELFKDDSNFELQRLHGMGEHLHNKLLSAYNVKSRIYAPVGGHKDLLAYLVRRLLENGANSSFVHQLQDKNQTVERLAEDPISYVDKLKNKANPKIKKPKYLYEPTRLNSKSINLDDRLEKEGLEISLKEFENSKTFQKLHRPNDADNIIEIKNPANLNQIIGRCHFKNKNDARLAIKNAQKAFHEWCKVNVKKRSQILEKIADLYEDKYSEFIYILTKEAGKTRQDAILEVREAVDFLRYYAYDAKEKFENSDGTELRVPLGIFVCISPWNFPLAIFTGQIAAALVAGNAVIAKPAEQTPLIADLAINLFYQAGIDKKLVQVLAGHGGVIGSALTSSPDIAGVAFTGSTATARLIDMDMANNGNPNARLIAETGGLNTMIIDSTALPEQAVKDVISSAFQSAGQRCSALRVLYVQKDIHDKFIELLKGAMDELKIGDPFKISTDIGPVVDKNAYNEIDAHCKKLESEGRLIHKLNKVDDDGYYISPHLFKLNSINELEKEIFGPILHLITFDAKNIYKVIKQINNKGYGLTFGIHSRVNSRNRDIATKVNCGNIYINRNQIGAVVAVQPFGGCNLSGTGPKAGGANYLLAFSRNTKKKAKHNLNKTLNKPIKYKPISYVNPVLTTLVNNQIKFDEATKLALKSAKNKLVNISFCENILTSPTGEYNSVQNIPRGNILISLDLSNLNSTNRFQYTTSLLEMVIISHASFNKPIVIIDIINKTEKRLIKEALKNLKKLGFNTKTTKNAINSTFINQNDIDTVFINEEGITQKNYRKLLAQLPGKRIRLLILKDDMELLCHEKTISEDITASGGNATLIISSN